VPSDTTIAVEMSAYAQAAVSNGSTAPADISAFIGPPHIEIDPSFPLAAAFEPVFSPNLVAAVPEPSSLAMLLAGFAGVGLVGWHSRGRAASA
jgi:hypothetical protein